MPSGVYVRTPEMRRSIGASLHTATARAKRELALRGLKRTDAQRDAQSLSMRRYSPQTIEGYVYIPVYPGEFGYEMGRHKSKHHRYLLVAEHRLVVARRIGRILTRRENVHHINGITDDNRDTNLELWSRPQPPGVRATERQHCATCTCEQS